MEKLTGILQPVSHYRTLVLIMMKYTFNSTWVGNIFYRKDQIKIKKIVQVALDQ